MSLFLRNRVTGIDSLILCGPDDGLEANAPPSLSSIHVLGAARRFRCFLGPRVMMNRYCKTTSNGVKS